MFKLSDCIVDPVFSIIIPTYKRPGALAECLKNIDEAIQSMPADIVEVLVTDDFNASETQLFLSQYNFQSNIKVLEGPKKGPAANRNNGAQYSNGEWLLFTDDDCLPDKDILKNYRKAIQEHNTIPVFEGKIITDKAQTRYDEEAPVNITGNNFWSCNICIRKDVFNNIGGFDEKFPYPYMEDIDFLIRLQNNKYEIRFIENAYVIHPWRIKRGWGAYEKCAKSILYFNEKNYSVLKHSKFMYFKIFIGGFPKRFSKLTEFKLRGFKDFILENCFLIILSIKFFFRIQSLEKNLK